MTPPHATRDAIADILAFHVEAGVDVAMGEEPVDRFAESGSEARSPARMQRPAETPQPGPPSAAKGAPAATRPPVGAAPPAPDIAAIGAREAAATAPDLDTLRSILDRFEGCPLKVTATQMVFADGNPKARIMFVGEAPGRDEDIQGKPFVGRSGQLLDRMLAAIDLDRTSVYIANVVPWRPPGNRTPTPQETAICLPFIRRQIELADPDILVCLGKPSAETLLGIKDGITKARGRWGEYDTGSRRIAAVPTFHPAFLLRSPLGKRMVWRDLLAIRNRLDALPPRAR
ncbi:uracil-DNA glycosylase [Ancylobacter sp. 6x-1]|uniref:Type-4 uracil-DNA glycosylase n=1 Tax=Ancylobacter crimeensis TaxID=2579147 RepID=A0ABT0D8Z1_9HYPH|nr:uracil-DNA glycosylase [Ancylobacter crimeensis]MCK0196413.1 uracil-DNA glycosylase [Ancylobacter crimeensis]